MITAPRVLTPLLLLFCAIQLGAAPAFNYPAAIAEARRAWSADARDLAELLRKLKAAAEKAAGAEKILDEARRTLARLKREREEALDDVRNGDFCDGCGRTRRDLLAHGESFPHPGQSRRPARPEDFERVENDFKTRMGVQERLIARYEPELKDARLELDAAHHRYLVLLPVYHKHIAEEQQHRLGKWFDEKTAAEAELKALQEAMAAAAAKIGKNADADQARLAQAELEQLNRQLLQRLSSAKFAEDAARQQERIYRKDVLASLDSLGKIAEPIPDRYGVSGWFISKSIRNPPLAVGYTVNAIYIGAPNGRATAASSDLQRLLDGTGKSTPAPKPDPKRPGDKSVQDLLDGK